jgi:AraC-like DNA-binding protein
MQEVPSAPSVIKLRFEGEPDSKSFHSWRDEFARKFLEMEMEPFGSALFRISVRLDALPGIVICNGLGTPQRSYSPPGAGQNSGDFVVLLPRGARMRYEQGRRAEEACDGDVLLNDTSRPWRLEMIENQLKLTATRIRRESLLALVPHAEDLTGRRPLPASPATVSLLTATLDLVRQFGPDLDPLVRGAVSQHLVDLSALVLGARGDTAELARGRGLAAAQLMVIQRYMVDQLSEPMLSVREAAARHNVSVRYVQQLFERSGTTFTRFLLEQRLLAAYDRVTNVLARAVSITQIASECGFGDLSTFNRAFRRRFGATPSDIRVEAIRRLGIMF